MNSKALKRGCVPVRRKELNHAPKLPDLNLTYISNLNHMNAGQKMW